ncbi:neutral zinc metallopeptidase [Erythrobacter sp.]|uniref:KPN_02809 family neutral zinc metallopeptidase n=1 Tax=Erythrobacter sp. TaxID=1042 RepID=UPI001425DA67|nr:neutral zinc metallopeptidase [Erythrobacter sp.]QIQ85915.1 MAG: zinc metalloprotease [Erythrobacter sp.]
MRLDRHDTDDIKVRSSGGGRAKKAGGLGIVGILIALAAAFFLDLDPRQTIGMMEGAQQALPQRGEGASEMSEAEVCAMGPYAAEACDALASLNATWEPVFARAGARFEQPVLDLYRGGAVTTEGCGSATSAAGPFYCPADMGIYIDTGFYDQLATMAGTGGDFARLYVIAHEYGHHIQNLTGIAGAVRQAKARDPSRANALQVRMELQADCYAGVWAGLNRERIEPGDMEEGLAAASSIGDDTLMRQAGRRIEPENFTHGTSAQRMAALKAGMETGDHAVCDRYFE